MPGLANHWVVYVSGFLYTCVILGNAGYHFAHGWAHADAERAVATEAAKACRENYAIQKRHSQLCAHDEADVRMSSFWCACRSLALEFTLCPPTSCAGIALSFSEVISKLGFAAIVAAAGATLAVFVGLKLFSVMRIDRKGILYPRQGLEYANQPIGYNADFPLLDSVRQRTPAITEIT